MFRKNICHAIAITCFAGSMVENAVASTHEFYKGKTVRIVVGASAGGAFDTWGRTISCHLGTPTW